MSKPSSATRKQRATASTPPVARFSFVVWLWLVFFAGSLFFLPQCLDRYLAPRFFFLSAVLLAAALWCWTSWRKKMDWRLNGFDIALLGWYGINLCSVAWAFSWSEAVFYSQKVLLLLGVYWLVRQCLFIEAGKTRCTLAQITAALTLAVGVLLCIQTGIAITRHGLDNQQLYDYATGVFGNKGLASDFLFFLLILNVFFQKEYTDRKWYGLTTGVLLVLIVVLQTRTVYLALIAAMLLYLSGRTILEPGFRPFMVKKMVPAGLAALLAIIALLWWKGQGSTLAERLNPATYLESASAIERRFVWYKTDLLNREHFWTGVGNGNWKIWFPSKNIEGAFRLQEKNVVMTRAHNDYLEIRAELGIVGAVLFVALFGLAFWAAARTARVSADDSIRHDLLVLSAGLAGYCVIQYFDFPRERIELQALLGLFFALLVFLSREVWSKLSGLSIASWKGTFMVLYSLGLLFNAVIGWYRISGEIHNVTLLKEQARGNLYGMQRAAVAAQNRFYEYNDVVIPLKWYEGIVYYQQNRIPEAVQAFERAYHLNPWAFQVVNNYGSALVQARRYPEAIDMFEKALYLNPRYDEGKFNIAYAWHQLGDTAKALNWLNRVDTIPNPPTESERLKNQRTLKQKSDFEQIIRGKTPPN